MMRRYLQFMITIVLMITISGSRETFSLECKKRGEIYSKCGIDPNCEPSCNYSKKGKCRAMCFQGCYCPRGLLRKNPPSDMRCVRPEECQSQGSFLDTSSMSGGFERQREECTRKGEIFQKCGRHPICEPSCIDRKPGGVVCKQMRCYQGCYCPTGLLRRNPPSDRKCVRPEECPGRGNFLDTSAKSIEGERTKEDCDRKGEIFLKCGKHSSCEPSCNNPTPGGIRCQQLRCFVGCYCPTGLLRRNPPSDRKCVRPEECPDRGSFLDGMFEVNCQKRGEVYNECGVAPKCEPSCAKPEVGVCNKACYAGCYCPKGLLRKNPPSDMRCVRPEECPGQGSFLGGMFEVNCQKRGEVYNDCGVKPECEPSCAQPHGRQCNKMCYQGCYCPRGLLRKNPPSDWRCIRPEECQGQESFIDHTLNAPALVRRKRERCKPKIYLPWGK